MAERFAREGRLVAFGASPADRSDARHVAVEFVHPVIVGKRALPALGLAGEGGQIAPQVALEAEAEDIAMAFGDEPDILAALAAARERGCLTIAFTRDSGAEWEFDLAVVADPLIRQEIAETLYHTLWEHVHIFLDNRGLLEGRAARPVHDSGASSFLYPFLGQQETDLDAILADVKQSILLKADEITALRTQTLTEFGDELLARRGRAARAPRRRRPAHRARQRRLGDRRDGRRRGLPHADVRRPAAARAGPHRGHRHHHRGRQRHRHRRDLPAPGHRLRPRGRRADRAVDERQLAERPRSAARGRASAAW